MLVNVDTYTYVYLLIELYLIEFRLLHFKNRLFRLFLYIEPQHSHQWELTFSKFPTFWMFSFLLITCEALPLNSLPLYYSHLVSIPVPAYMSCLNYDETG